jgi:CubicO group peptidase (beta-lactamase class C family)
MSHNLISILLVFVLFVACNSRPAKNETLPKSTPEAEGVSSQNILNFIDAAEKSKHELHSIMILRHGKVIAEGWWAPYQPELKHTTYSTSKSFTSTAVGFAVSEHRLSLTDKVVSFFPNDLPDTVSKNLALLTVKDLITMSVGQEPDPTFNIVTRDTNWIRSFFATPVKNRPGTKFLYNSLATYMLSAIVQKVTGEKVIDYLKPRLFEPLKIEGVDWEVDPKGINTGGWGLRLKTEDMAKFGQLYLQKGKWNDLQILPAEWIEEATSFKIDQAPGVPPAAKDTNDWMQGYCYQFWRCRNNAYRADGAYGQYVIVLPEHDAVIAITGETPDMQGVLNLVWEHLLPAFKKEKLPVNSEVANKLNDKLTSLALPLFPKVKASPLESTVNNVTFSVSKNELDIDSITFNLKDHQWHLVIHSRNNGYDMGFGSGNWKLGETSRMGPYLVAGAKGAYSGLRPLKIAGNYQWSDSNTLKLKLRYIESPHSQDISCSFSNDSISVGFANSNDFGKKVTQLKGIRMK